MPLTRNSTAIWTCISRVQAKPQTSVRTGGRARRSWRLARRTSRTRSRLSVRPIGAKHRITSNEAVISGAVNLNDYDSVIRILGAESTADDTFNATEQTLVEAFIAAGGHLFVSGSEIAWDLDSQGGGVSFFENTLKGNYAADDANTYNVTVPGGSIFAGIPNFSFSNGNAF